MAICSRRLLGVCKYVGTTYPRFQHARQMTLYQHRGSCISSFIFDNRSNEVEKRCSLDPYLRRDGGFMQCRNIFTSITNCSEDQKTSQKGDDKTYDKNNTQKPESEKKLSVFERFKKTYKEHGKVLIGVHLLTSSVWFGTFFYAAKVGVDVIPFMEWLGFSEKIISPFRSSSLGDIALAYLMYKLATPARYTVTLAGTNLAIKALRKSGKMMPKSESSSLRSLARDSRKELGDKRRAVKKKTSKFENKMKNKMKAEIKERQAYVKATFTKFRSKLRDKHNKNGKQHQWRR